METDFRVQRHPMTNEIGTAPSIKFAPVKSEAMPFVEATFKRLAIKLASLYRELARLESDYHSQMIITHKAEIEHEKAVDNLFFNFRSAALKLLCDDRLPVEQVEKQGSPFAHSWLVSSPEECPSCFATRRSFETWVANTLGDLKLSKREKAKAEDNAHIAFALNSYMALKLEPAEIRALIG